MTETEKFFKTILVVEDDYSIREALRDALECEGYQVLTAQNGQEGLDKIRQSSQKPCLVLLDMMMPIMNGRAFLDEVLKDAMLAPIPVLIVSASVGPNETYGSVGYIKKPVDLELLLDMVERHCAMAHPSP